MRQAMAVLRRWFNRVRIAAWLHPEFDGTRRALVFASAAIVAANMLAQVPTYAADIDAGDEIFDLLRRRMEDAYCVMREAVECNLFANWPRELSCR